MSKCFEKFQYLVYVRLNYSYILCSKLFHNKRKDFLLHNQAKPSANTRLSKIHHVPLTVKLHSFRWQIRHLVLKKVLRIPFTAILRLEILDLPHISSIKRKSSRLNIIPVTGRSCERFNLSLYLSHNLNLSHF